MKKNKFKSYLKRVIVGFKHAWNIPSLPKNVLYFHNHIFTRMFRVIGGISIIGFLSGSAKSYLFTNDILWPLYYLVLFLALIHFIYIIAIKIIKTIHMIKVWKSGKLEVRNSPLDKFATSAAKLFHCWKFGCEVGSAGLGLVGSGFLIDQILEAGGQKKVFTPLIGNGVYFLVKRQVPEGQSLLDEIKRQTKDLEKFKEQHSAVREIFDQAEKTLDSNSTQFNKDDFNDLKKGLNEMRNADDKKLSDMAKDLAKNIRKYGDSSK
uniref:Uncharacterized protein n=1 Tax=Metarhizium album TaxID=92629 RepID=A0A891GWY9_9HYPO|nr:hypothetical protein K8J96_mgp02 [Metarhizium album]QRK27498.1 hypothetical protein [Metarhizium album]